MLLNEAVAMTTRPQLGAAILFIHVGKRDVDSVCEWIQRMWLVNVTVYWLSALRFQSCIAVGVMAHQVRTQQ